MNCRACGSFSIISGTAFREEIRITLLHELGHYLGLNEAEVAALGLG
jgi:predicted Zn-dependent protease with MMP-like domain